VRRTRVADAGLTMVELMITLVIASLVTTATFAFFAGQQTIYESQAKLLTTQQGLWSAMDMMAKYVRSAGGGMLGCVRADPDGAGPDPGDPPPGGAATPQTGLRVFRSGTGVFRIPPIWIQNGAAGVPDTLTIAYGSGTSGTFNDATLGANVTQPLSAVTTLATQSARFFTNEFILLVDSDPARASGDRGCSLLQVTGVVAGTDTLQHDPTVSIWNPNTNVANFLPFTYPGGLASSTGGVRNFGTLTWIRFAINSVGAPTVPPQLTMTRLDTNGTPEVLADGIEDMQIAYACDLQPLGAPDGVLTEGTNAASRNADEWTYNQAGDVEQVGCNRPDVIRITLTARSLTPDNLLAGVTGNTKPAVEDGAAGVADQYRHRLATVSIYPRN
jgi:prepilin-type N-terminal cleavage/methylation domain-containing protein